MPFPHKLIYVGDGWGICDHLCLLWSWLRFKNVIENGNLSVISITKQHYTLPRIWHVSGKIKKNNWLVEGICQCLSIRNFLCAAAAEFFFTSAHVEQNDNKTSCRLSLVLTCHVLYFNGTYLKDYGSKFKHGFQISSDLPFVKMINSGWQDMRICNTGYLGLTSCYIILFGMSSTLTYAASIYHVL